MNRAVLVVWGLLIALVVCAQPAAAAAEAATQPAKRHTGELYYFDTCAVCRGMLGVRGDTISLFYEERNVLFCSTDCQSAFERDLGIANHAFARGEARQP